MKILHVVQGYPPAMGGTEEAFAHLSDRLVSQFGDDVTVFTTNCYGGDAFNRFGLPGMQAGKELINGVRVRRFKVATWLSWLFKVPQFLATKLNLPCSQYLKTLYQGPLVIGLGRAIRQSDADLVVASSFPLLHMYTALKAARQAQKPVILVGGLHPGDHLSFDRPMIYDTMQKADACIAYTSYEAEYLKARGIPAEKVFVIPLGVDPQNTSQLSKEDIRRSLGLPDGPLVGFIGQISAHKGVDLLIRAMQLVWVTHPAARLLIAGAKRPFAKTIEAMVAGLPGEQKEKIALYYDFNRDDKADLFKALDIFVYPSRFESFGIAFLEAWREHKPVIGLESGAIPCVVEHDINGLLVGVDDAAGLARAIGQLLDDPGKAARLAEKGYQTIKQQYSWSPIATRFHTLYQDVVNCKGGTWQA